MPCNSIRTTTVDIGKLDVVMLTLAASSLGHSVGRNGDVLTWNGCQYDRRTGKLLVNQYSSMTQQQLQQAYAKQVVLQQARKAGWKAVRVAPRPTA